MHACRQLYNLCPYSCIGGLVKVSVTVVRHHDQGNLGTLSDDSESLRGSEQALTQGGSLEAGAEAAPQRQGWRSICLAHSLRPGNVLTDLVSQLIPDSIKGQSISPLAVPKGVRHTAAQIYNPV